MLHILGLDHIGVAVADRRGAERFYGAALGLERSADGLFRLGQSAFELLTAPPESSSPGPARQGIAHLALQVVNLQQARGELAVAGLSARLEGGCAPNSPAQVAWLEREQTAGVPLCLVERPQAIGGSVPGADGLIERIDHIGIASADNARAHADFNERLGLPVESTQTDTEVRIPAEFFVSDKYGVAFNTRPAEAVGGLKVTFFTVGDCDLEVLQDYDPRTAAERAAAESGTKRDQSAISRFVQRRGPGPHHVALKVRDIEAMLRRLVSQGVDVLDSQGRPGSRRARIAFLHPQSTHGVLFHLVEREALPG